MRRRWCSGLVALALGLTGCSSGRPGVGARAIDADLLFSATTTIVPTAGTTLVGQDAPTNVVPPAVATIPTIPFEAGTTTTVAAGGDCRPAALDAFPDESAPLNVPDKSRLPAARAYRWKRAGTLTEGGVTTKLAGFEQRVVRNVHLVSDAPRQSLTDPNAPPTPRLQYTFEVVQPELGTDAFVVSTYFVDTSSPNTVDEETPTGGQRATVGRPERGLVLRKLVRVDRHGQPLPGGFAPAVGLLLAPLPIRTGERFASSAVDLRTNRTMQYQAQVTRRARVDACGTVLDGWLVDGTMTVTEGATTSARYALIVAPQFGAVVIDEVLDGEQPGGRSARVEQSVGERPATAAPA